MIQMASRSVQPFLLDSSVCTDTQTTLRATFVAIGRICVMLAMRSNCSKSVNNVVKFVARNGVYFSRMYSPIGHSAQFCSVLLKVSLRDLGGVNGRLVWQLYNRDLIYQHKDDINVICELLAVKHGDMELDLFSNSVLDAFIEFLCTK